MSKAKNYVALDKKGFKIKQSYDHISYIESDYAVRIARRVENTSPHVFVIDFDQMTGWFPPHQNELISKEKKQQIMERVEDELKNLLAMDLLNTYVLKRKENCLIVSGTKRPMRSIMEESDRHTRKTQEIFKKLG